MVEGESGGGEGVVALGTRRRSRVVVLGARSRARAVVLGPRLLASLASCCRPRASVRRSLGSEGWGGGEGREEGGARDGERVEEGGERGGAFARAGAGPSSARRPSCSFCVHWLFVAMWLVVFGCRCLRVAVVVCASCHVVSWS